MKSHELDSCEIQRWYPRFKSVSLRTIIHPLPESFIAYLQEDGVFLPKNSEAIPSRPKGECEDDDYQRWEEEDDEADEPNIPSFPDLEAAVTVSIDSLDGSVFPKLNWSAPKDSAWISSHGNLKCTNFGEICLLLKASDSLVHDLCHAYDSCEDKAFERPRNFFLALRKWYDMRPEMEFRGFVRHGLLVGVSQREITCFYPALLESRETLGHSIFQFFVDSLSEAFELEDYTFDCYVTRAGKVKLVDFNPWGAFTLPLLFTWDELEATYVKFKNAYYRNSDGDAEPISCAGLHMSWKRANIALREQGFKPEFRIVESEGHVQINLRVAGGVPYDYVQTGPGSAWDEFLRHANDELQQQNRDAAAGG
ncbi:hypothetical protein KP509_33G045000 [Ceratopteris richardii]|uniref:Cell division cycle protein 123 n=1 Tax=Ceratopteris richardii TaxID=49495 RepID=A0A8T2QP43_CERRI|nr:hypothetical protein KP509_33G045000 [Ceratopteris richardii]